MYKAGKFAEAVTAYDESIAADPTVASVYANKAAALSGQGITFFPQAVRACVTAAALDPGYARARQRLGSLCVKLGELDTAVAAAEERVKADPESAGAAALLRQLRILRDGRAEGNAAFRDGEKEKARGVYTAALEKAAEKAEGVGGGAASSSEGVAASDPAVLAALPGAGLLLCNRAACASSLGDHAATLSDADAALRVHPEYTKASLRRAHALDALGRVDDAVAAFAALRLILPGDQSIAESLNNCRAAQGGGRGGGVIEKAGPIHIASGDHYRRTVDCAKLALVDFTASWCGPCRQIAPVFERLALQHPAVHFLKVDVDEVQEVAAAENVRSMPTFKLFRYGVKVAEFSGADPNKLGQLINQYLPTIS